jgi:hypothetical protein
VPARSADSQHLRQSLGSQNRAGGGGPGAAPPRPVPLHTHLLRMAQRSRTLVRENRALGHRPRRLYLRARSGPQAARLHQRLLSQCSAYLLEVLRSSPSMEFSLNLRNKVWPSIISAVFMAEKADDQTVAISASTRRTSSGSSNALMGLSRCRTSANNSQTAGSRVARRARAA